MNSSSLLTTHPSSLLRLRRALSRLVPSMLPHGSTRPRLGHSYHLPPTRRAPPTPTRTTAPPFLPAALLAALPNSP